MTFTPPSARRLALAALVAVAVPALAQAQSAIIYGSLGNFDISNDTGKVCHGFEIEIEGLDSSQVVGTFSAQRYGAASVIPSTTGVRVRWESPYDSNSGQWSERTLPHTVAWFPGQCYQWNPATYQDSGCEHFGTSTTANPTRVTSRWLCEDSTRPGVLVPNDPPTAVPMPTYYVNPPAQANNPPELVMEVEAPEPAEAPSLYGNAQWMRVYKQELTRPLTLDELMADNPDAVPMNLNQLEADWQVLQDEPVAGGNGNRRRKRNQGSIAPTTRAVVRRIELYRYNGVYDAVTHEAMCADLLCDAPTGDELGELISVQMTAANVQPDALIVATTGNGRVDSADKLINCGSKCAQPYTAGAEVTLKAKPATGYALGGWTGACAGTASTCTVTVNGAVNVGATFVPAGGGGGTAKPVKVKVKAKRGTVTGVVDGGTPVIDCGLQCAASVAPLTSLTLTAVVPDGKSFLGWGGACSGTGLTCTLMPTANTLVTATFSK